MVRNREVDFVEMERGSEKEEEGRVGGGKGK